MGMSALALGCLTCHRGPDDDRHATDLSVLSSTEIARHLHAFRSGEREGTVMPRLARGLDDADIEALATSLGRAPTP